MPVPRQCLSHDVCQHALRRAVLEFDRVPFDVVAHELELNVEMLRSCMMNWIICERNGPLIIDVDGFGCIF